MRYPLRGLLPLALAWFAGSAYAQSPVFSTGPSLKSTGLITDPARSAAARDTLLQQADQLRQRATQGSSFFVTNANSRPRRRVVVSGEVPPPGAPPLPKQPLNGSSITGEPFRWAPGTVSWEHITRYRRNGRVQERFYLRWGTKVLLRQRWLNGTVTWLSMPEIFQGIQGVSMRHRGFYLRTGYVLLDGEEYVLLPAR